MNESEDDLRARLTPEQFHVTCNGGTEPPFDNEYWDHKETGTYVDVISGVPLFSSEAKFDSGTGWPSFWQPLADAVRTREDPGFFGTRTEVHCRRCGGHLGHVFEDGPKPTGLRYCMNGVSLAFRPG